MRNLMKGRQTIYLNRKDVRNKENLIVMNKKYKNQLQQIDMIDHRGNIVIKEINK